MFQHPRFPLHAGTFVDNLLAPGISPQNAITLQAEFNPWPPQSSQNVVPILPQNRKNMKFRIPNCPSCCSRGANMAARLPERRQQASQTAALSNRQELKGAGDRWRSPQDSISQTFCLSSYNLKCLSILIMSKKLFELTSRSCSILLWFKKWPCHNNVQEIILIWIIFPNSFSIFMNSSKKCDSCLFCPSWYFFSITITNLNHHGWHHIPPHERLAEAKLPSFQRSLSDCSWGSWKLGSCARQNSLPRSKKRAQAQTLKEFAAHVLEWKTVWSKIETVVYARTRQQPPSGSGQITSNYPANQQAC